MFEGFPYTNFHQLNLDWIINIAKNFLDQYTNIQQTITQGLEDLDTKADQLTALLDAWYEEHSQDIANQLADALQDLNTWYTQHQDYLDATLAENIAAFNTAADTKTAASIASIPADYTTLSNDVTDLKSALRDIVPDIYSTISKTDGSFINSVSLQYSLSATYQYTTPILLNPGDSISVYSYAYAGSTVKVSVITRTKSDGTPVEALAIGNNAEDWYSYTNNTNTPVYVVASVCFDQQFNTPEIVVWSKLQDKQYKDAIINVKDYVNGNSWYIDNTPKFVPSTTYKTYITKLFPGDTITVYGYGYGSANLQVSQMAEFDMNGNILNILSSYQSAYKTYSYTNNTNTVKFIGVCAEESEHEYNYFIKASVNNAIAHEYTENRKIIITKDANGIYVYVPSKISSNYIKYFIRHIENQSQNKDVYSIYRISATDDKLTELFYFHYDEEMEGAIKLNGASDYVGGFHGNEIIYRLEIVIDGLETINLNRETFTYACESVDLYADSNLYDADDSTDNIFKRTKHINFTSNGLKIRNIYKALHNLDIVSCKLAMFTIGYEYDNNSLLGSYRYGNDLTSHTFDTSATPAQVFDPSAFIEAYKDGQYKYHIKTWTEYDKTGWTQGSISISNFQQYLYMKLYIDDGNKTMNTNDILDQISYYEIDV